MRKFVTIRKISEINDIDGADRIKTAVIDGWEVVVKAGEFSVGDDCVFFEIDSFIPVEDMRFEFLHKSSIREFEGKKGVRLKTIRLRGQISQGLALPLSLFPEIQSYIEEYPNEDKYEMCFDGLLGVIKYDTFLSKRGSSSGGAKIIASHAAGEFPWYVPKTDEERIENLWNKRNRLIGNDTSREFYYTLKVDGSSTTVLVTTERTGYYDGLDVDDDGTQLLVCSRKLVLKYNADGTFWKAIQNSNVDKAVKAIYAETGRQIAIQGETLDPAIQGGRENFTEPTFLAFSAFDVDAGKHMPYSEFIEMMDHYSVPRVPVLKVGAPFEEFKTLNEMKAFVDNMKSTFADKVFSDTPEGIVFHACDGNKVSFKCISREYLLKTGE